MAVSLLTIPSVTQKTPKEIYEKVYREAGIRETPSTHWGHALTPVSSHQKIDTETVILEEPLELDWVSRAMWPGRNEELSSTWCGIKLGLNGETGSCSKSWRGGDQSSEHTSHPGLWASSSQQGPAQPRLERPWSESAQPDGLPPSDDVPLWASPQP